jgi:hypothetical protein
LYLGSFVREKLTVSVLGSLPLQVPPPPVQEVAGIVRTVVAVVRLTV